MFKKYSLFFIACSFTATLVIGQEQITFKPGSDCGKDAIVWFLENVSPTYGNANEKNYGNSALPLMEWTWGGIPGRRWLLIDFQELAIFPPETNILEAKLSFFHQPNTGDDDHSTPAMTGLPHIAFIQRITDPWEEDEVTWNNQPATTTDNQVSIGPPNNVTQDFEGIDVTGIIQDMVALPDNRFGMLLKMELSEYYQKLIFASSDSETPQLWPELTITYEEVSPLIPYDEALAGTECSNCIVQVPNIFTPNNDGVNDEFGILSHNCSIIAFSLEIYNRWGELVFNSDDVDKWWDGNHNGKPAPIEAYFYIAQYHYSNGSSQQKKGSLHLAR